MKNEKLIILGHENPDVDSIVSGFLLEVLLNKKGYDAEFIIPDEKIENECVNICLSYGLDPYKFMKKLDMDNKSNKYILVDHNERNLGGEIVAIIDHHPNDKSIKCKNYYNYVSSSTSCIICKDNEECFNNKEIELALLAAFVDTASFNSTKTVDSDKKWVMELCDKLNINDKKLYEIGLSLTDINDINHFMLNGLKKYQYKELVIYSSYVHVKYDEEVLKLIQKTIEMIKKYILKNNIDIFIFIVHDMINFKTKVFQIEKDKMLEFNYEKYTSRGGVIIPNLYKRLIKI